MVTGESAHRDDPDLGTECLGAFLQSRGHDIRGTSAFHIQQTGSTGPIDQWSQVEEDRREGVLTVSAHVFPAVLIDTQDSRHPKVLYGLSFTVRTGINHKPRSATATMAASGADVDIPVAHAPRPTY